MSYQPPCLSGLLSGPPSGLPKVTFASNSPHLRVSLCAAAVTPRYMEWDQDASLQLPRTIRWSSNLNKRHFVGCQPSKRLTDPSYSIRLASYKPPAPVAPAPLRQANCTAKMEHTLNRSAGQKYFLALLWRSPKGGPVSRWANFRYRGRQFEEVLFRRRRPFSRRAELPRFPRCLIPYQR